MTEPKKTEHKREKILFKCAVIRIEMPYFDWLLHGNNINKHSQTPPSFSVTSLMYE